VQPAERRPTDVCLAGRAWAAVDGQQSGRRRAGYAQPMTAAGKPRIAITYCSQCKWLLRAAWRAQELLSTFGTDLGEVVLLPGTGGIFQIAYDGDVL
jgi:selT/selW/selH-like putative selenoprotein